MNENEIKKEIKKDNKKALPFFIALIIIGAIGGFVSSSLSHFASPNETINIVKDGLIAFMQYAGAIILPATCALLLIPAYINLRKSKNLYTKLKETDMEDLHYEIENLINRSNIYVEIESITIIFLIGLSIWTNNHKTNLALLISTLVTVIVSTTLSITLSKKLTELNRLLNPHMKISVFEGVGKKFNKMYDLSDEYEKAVIGRASFKAMKYAIYFLLVVSMASLFTIVLFSTGLSTFALSLLLLIIIEVTFINEANNSNHK